MPPVRLERTLLAELDFEWDETLLNNCYYCIYFTELKTCVRFCVSFGSEPCCETLFFRSNRWERLGEIGPRLSTCGSIPTIRVWVSTLPTVNSRFAPIGDIHATFEGARQPPFVQVWDVTLPAGRKSSPASLFQLHAAFIGAQFEKAACRATDRATRRPRREKSTATAAPPS